MSNVKHAYITFNAAAYSKHALPAGAISHLLQHVPDEAPASSCKVLGDCAFPLVAAAILPRECADANVLPHVHLPCKGRCRHNSQICQTIIHYCAAVL